MARYHDTTPERIVELFCSSEFLIYMLGFTPGYPYIGGVPRELVTPRLDSPRLKVPAGPVGIGGEQLGIYPIESPGGFRLVGNTPVRLYDPENRQTPVLLEAGARIFEFTPGFVHTKTMVADDLYASVGSCNLDYRSFYLQFENGVWLCGDPAVLSVRDDFLQTMEVCQEITLDDCRTLSFPRRIVQTVYRLFAPLF